jgi:hypothetical protein
MASSLCWSHAANLLGPSRSSLASGCAAFGIVRGALRAQLSARYAPRRRPAMFNRILIPSGLGLLLRQRTP